MSKKRDSKYVDVELCDSTRHNMITELFQECYCELASIKFIDLSFCNLSVLPRQLLEYNSFSKCESLILSNNKLSAFPSNISDMVFLRELYVANNYISDFYPIVKRLIINQIKAKGCIILEILDLTSNEIQDITIEMYCFLCLIPIVMINGNPISTKYLLCHGKKII